ncbi:hypothetical protein BRM1_00260 [Brevibacterium sp. BRM-1]|uniref:hypothetical protein n=1 Tax=Brevibacterium sp. BRM-1 TaxID=2999062 RepID=UPI00227F0EB5|nr:hypothetical protein [Brevibacterium sp. BRM-1]WAL40348.1 hypothetical protein BRM1_00260 [Brevibacterium sp. BRM-1]
MIPSDDGHATGGAPVGSGGEAQAQPAEPGAPAAPAAPPAPTAPVSPPGPATGHRQPAAERFDALFADLAAAEEGRDAHERAGGYSDLVAEAYADSELAARLAGSVGRPVELRTARASAAGRLTAVGRGWCIVRDGASGLRVLVNAARLVRVRLRGRAHAGERGISALSMGAPLRQWTAEGRAVRVELSDGGSSEGALDAVARDYVQLRGAHGFDVLPFAAIELVAELR